MKKIGIDARLYFQTGVGVYIRNLLHYLQKTGSKDTEYLIYVMESDSPRIKFDNPKFKKREVTSSWHTWSEQTHFHSQLMNDNLDLMHFTYFSYPVRYKRPYIATIHDATPLHHKTGKASTHNPMIYEFKYQAFKYVISQQVKNAKKIITPTKYVKEQLGEVYGKEILSKITPIYEGVNHEMIETGENKELIKKYPRPYLLYVGNFYPHKNVDRLLDAYKMIKNNVPIVFLGPDNYFAQKLKQKIKKENIKNVYIQHSPHTADLIFFYKHAIALVNPSLSEGFGLPLIEAAYYKTPIVASDLAVFKELYGKRYTSFDPLSVEDIRDKLELVVNKTPKVDYSDLLQKYSFKKMTEETAKLYRE